MIFQNLFGILPKASIDEGVFFKIFMNINTVIYLIMFSVYYLLKKKASIDLYNIEPLNFLYTLQTVILQIFAGLFGFLVMIVGSYNLSMSKVDRTVTPKGGKLKEKNLFF